MDGIIRGRGRPLARPDDGLPPTARKSGWKRPRALTGLAILALTGVIGSAAYAVFVPPNQAPPSVNPTVASSTEFDITGFLESATLDTPGDPHSGGVAVINGQTIVIPRETVVILPANALTWQELFTHAPTPYGPTQTGMALADTPKPTTTYEFHVVGNRVLDPNGTNGCATAGGCDRMIAGLVNVSQTSLSSGQGYINYIDYGAGELEIGGQPGVKGTGARVQINDPANSTSVGGSGRYGIAHTPDDRFQVDQDNPTIAAETGFPMCIPRVLPTATAGDPQCPQSNRPVVSNPVVDTSGITPQPNTLVAGTAYSLFRMDTPAAADSGVGCLRTPCADPRLQAPFEIGDYVTFGGTKESDANGFYTSAHTVIASVGIYTQKGIDPAYVTIEVSLIGTGGLTVFGAGEAAIRTRFEGMSTDESRMIGLYGVDINPANGTTTDREWGYVMPDPGPPGGAVRGRWRFRPPCTDTIAALATKPGKGCVPPPAGQFIPVTREVRAVIMPDVNSPGTLSGVAAPLSQFLPGTLIANPSSQIPGTPGSKTSANGIYYGQYHAPIGEYIFPENVPGTAVPENNFNAVPFLANGGYQSITGTLVGILNPWPSNVKPAPLVCPNPGLAINGAPYAVPSGGSVQLSGSLPAGISLPVSIQWTAGTLAGGIDLNANLTGATTTTPTFNAAGLAAGTYNITLTAGNLCGTASVATTITVNAAPVPTIKPIQDVNVVAGTPVVITATSTANPAPTWTWTAALSNPVPTPALTQIPSAASANANSTITFNPTTAGVYKFTVSATNANGTSAPTTVTVNVAASVPTNISFGATLEYRVAKQRLVMTATSTDPTITGMTLLPYLTESGTIFDPAVLGTNLTISLVTPGAYTITLVGAPKPACNLGGTYATPCSQFPITVKATKTGVVGFVGTSGATALQKIRA
jgi:hypothetical protein